MAAGSFNQAESYANLSHQATEDGLELMKLLSIQKGSRVLDYGCGTGNLTKVLADLVGPEGEVVGIDPDVERIQMAREKYPADNLTYIGGSHESIPGRDYDAVFCNYVLHRVEDKDAVFQTMADVLKRGGQFGFFCGRYFDITETLFKHVEAFSKEIVDEYRSLYFLSTPDEFASLAQSYNFEVIHWKKGAYEFKFDSVEELIEFYMVNSRGQYDITHFDVGALKSHYKDGGALSLPNLLAVLVKK